MFVADFFDLSDPIKPLPTNQANIMELESIALLNENPNYNLALTFKNEVCFFVKMRTYEDREVLVSALITLRGFLYDSVGSANSKPDLLRITTDGVSVSSELKI